MSQLPIVAVVGRPNVGKSTLVNRILSARAAVVDEAPGVTRDRREFRAEWAGRHFILVDTGGWVTSPSDELAQDIGSQAEAAAGSADVILFVVDGTVGISDDDAGVARLLQESTGPVIVAANKIDDADKEAAVAELWSLGLGEPVPVSALHGRGVGDLCDRVIGALPDSSDEAVSHEVPSLAIVGKPNVGKSTLLNRLSGQDRVLVSPVPGTTRDPIDIEINLGGVELRLIDTAGIRRQPRVSAGSEYYSVLRARQALASADAALLLIDATDGVTHQDQRIAEEAGRSGSGLVVFLNKWDIADSEERERTTEGVGDRLQFISWAPVIRGSALTGAQLSRLPGAISLVLENRSHRVATGRLNRLVRKWTEAHPPPVRKGRRPRVVYAVQAGVDPPTIVLFVRGGELGPEYLRFIENRLRAEFPLEGTPVRVLGRRRARREAHV